MKKEIEVNENMLEGRNAVTEALKAGRTIDKVFLASGDTDSTLRYIASLAKKNGAVVSLSDELPQSYVLADGAVVDTVYLSELSPAAMRRRAEKMIE